MFALNRKKLSIVGSADISPRLVQALTCVSASIAVIIINKGGAAEDMQGTGFCVDERGLFITAYHYLQGIERATFILDREYEAVPVAVDAEKDLALFSVTPAPPVKALRFAASLPAVGAGLLGVGHVRKGPNAVSLAGYAASYLDRLDAVIDDGSRAEIDPERLECSIVLTGSGLYVPGFSGGPILNVDAEVEALTSGGDGDGYVTAIAGAAARELTDWYRQRLG